MNKLTSVILGLGLVALQGCSAAPVTEDVAESKADLNTTCATNGGVFPTKAALAVAMGIELGRFEPSKDLVNVNYQYVTLSSTGLARCTNGCKNTKAILGQQFAQSSWTGGASIFDPTSYTTELVNGFNYQSGLNTLVANRGLAGAPDHKATLKLGPVNLGTGACGVQYVFQVDNPDGSAMTAAQAANMVYWFCYFGMPAPSQLGFSCSNNPYVGFFTTTTGCDAGHYCIAIDPTDGDNSTDSSTSAGSAPTYQMNRVYDPNGTLLGTACITTKGVLTTLSSKCSSSPSTCGYDYCQ